MLAAEAAFGRPFSFFPPHEKSRNTESDKITILDIKNLQTMLSPAAGNFCCLQPEDVFNLGFCC
jgi:hypothetical protein